MNVPGNHPLALLVSYFVFSAAVSAMPEPDAQSSKGYLWSYHFLHILAGDLSAIVGSRAPKP